MYYQVQQRCYYFEVRNWRHCLHSIPSQEQWKWSTAFSTEQLLSGMCSAALTYGRITFKTKPQRYRGGKAGSISKIHSWKVPTYSIVLAPVTYFIPFKQSRVLLTIAYILIGSGSWCCRYPINIKYSSAPCVFSCSSPIAVVNQHLAAEWN